MCGECRLNGRWAAGEASGYLRDDIREIQTHAGNHKKQTMLLFRTTNAVVDNKRCGLHQLKEAGRVLCGRLLLLAENQWL